MSNTPDEDLILECLRNRTQGTWVAKEIDGRFGVVAVSEGVETELPDNEFDSILMSFAPELGDFLLAVFEPGMDYEECHE